MSTPVLVIAESGAGKSASLRNFDPTKTLLIQSIPKPLPFRNPDWKVFDPEKKTGNIFVTDNASEIMKIMQGTKRKIIVIDDFQYILADELMRRYTEKGYDKFSEIGYNGWRIATIAAQLPADVRVYILAHSHTDENGKTKVKTPGKLLDTHSVEGMFTIVMKAIVVNGEYLFTTKTSGSDTVKTPMGMFEEDMIPNDLAAVDAAIIKYYPQNFTNVAVATQPKEQ